MNTWLMSLLFLWTTSPIFPVISTETVAVDTASDLISVSSGRQPRDCGVHGKGGQNFSQETTKLGCKLWLVFCGHERRNDDEISSWSWWMVKRGSFPCLLSRTVTSVETHLRQWEMDQFSQRSCFTFFHRQARFSPGLCGLGHGKPALNTNISATWAASGRGHWGMYDNALGFTEEMLDWFWEKM